MYGSVMMASGPGTTLKPSLAALSLEPEAYVGSYSNELWGTFVVRQDGEQLSVRLGDLRPAIASTGTDTFRLTGGLNEAGRFVVADGEVRALVAELALGDTPVRFERVEGD